jgi:tRNA U55 pseudouridine synthase TruB
LGELLGTGAYLTGLVRTEVGDYQLNEAMVLDDAEAAAVELHLLDL